MKAEIVRGGSGDWGLWWPSYKFGSKLAQGNVPSRVDNRAAEAAIVRQIMRVYDAEVVQQRGIDRINAPRGGTIFTVELPLTKEQLDGWCELRRGIFDAEKAIIEAGRRARMDGG